MLKHRILFGTVLAALFVLVLWLDHTLSSDSGFYIIVSAACTVGLFEFYRLASAPDRCPQTMLGIMTGVVLIASQWACQHGVPGLSEQAFLTIFFVFMLISLGLAALPSRAKSFDSVSATVFGLIYLWLPFHFAISLRHLPMGEEFVIFLVASAKSGDIFAYFFGRALGRHRLAPTISPKKTIEGACAGLGGSAIIGAVIWVTFSMESRMLEFGVTIPPVLAAAIGFVIGLAAQLGDLFESFLKRRCNAKDSSNLLPGLGGVLDIIDSFTISAPVAYLLFRWLLGTGS